MTFAQVYKTLLKHYGHQLWWPAETPFEVMVGAILVQNTAWSNVERAIARLGSRSCLAPQAILAAPLSSLTEWLKPSGYFNIKAQRLRNYCQWYINAGEFSRLSCIDTNVLRKQLLAVNGIGPETADDILLYAFERPVFVIDVYARRIFSRLKLLEDDAGYEALRHQFETGLQTDVAVFNEYHALIVCHAKNACKKRPDCVDCCLARICPSCGM